MDRYIVKNGKKLRYGYTTGSCAAAAARAAVRMLFTCRPLETVTIDTPMGWELKLDVHDIVIEENLAQCSIIKDAGDDPDATDGIKIFAEARRTEEDIITVTGGRGIGTVTRKGLPAPAGGPAINPVPMKMILSEAGKEKPEGKGVRIEISAPEGSEIAKKTFNPKLGIEGGISILGTTGIVEPMSNDAIMESLALEISMLRERGRKAAVFVPGKYGKDFIAANCNIEDSEIITTSNYIGYMLDQAVYYGIEKILFAGSIGKLVKVAGGIFDTHSRVTDARVEILAANYALLGGSNETVKKIMGSLTTEEALDYIDKDELYLHLAERISERCMKRVNDKIDIEVILFSQEKGLLAQTGGAESFAAIIKEESAGIKNRGESMNRLKVLGLGPGGTDYITPAVIKALKESDIIIGGSRNLKSVSAIESLDLSGKEFREITGRLDEMTDYILNRISNRTISVVASGDPGFYGILSTLKKIFSPQQLEVIPGISSLQYMFSKLAIPWHDACLGSLHGRDEDIAGMVRNSKAAAFLTDSRRSCSHIAEILTGEGMGSLTMHAGIRLSYDDEEICTMEVRQFIEKKKDSDLCVVVIENE